MEPSRGFDPDQLLTPEDAASFLAIKSETLAHWRTRQQGPAFRKIGRAIRYRRGDLITYSNSRVCGNTVEARQFKRA